MKSLVNIPSILVISLLIRILISGASIGEAIALLGLCALYAGHQYMESKRELPVNKEIRDRVVELEEQVKIVKDRANSIALSTGLRK